MGVRRWVRWVVVGRRDGYRAQVRREVGFCTWLDDPPPGGDPVVRAPAADAADLEDAVPPAPTEVQDGWIRVLSADELPESEPVEVFADGRAVVVVRLASGLYALDSICPHAGGPLADGHLDDCVLTCPWHGWSFDVRTGVSQVSDEVAVPTFEIKEDGGGLWVRLGPDPAG